MKKTRSALCLLLILALLFTFAACSKSDLPAVPEDDTADTPADYLSPAPEPFIEPEIIPSPDEGLTPDPFVLINNIEQVLDRPHKIEPGTVATFHSNDVPAYTPWNATADQWLLKNIYEGLVYCYMGRPDDIRPLIAESWHVSDDLLTWTFKIREGIKFTDGTFCDAAAVSASWDHYQEASPATFQIRNIQSWEARANNIFVVQLSAPCTYIETVFAELYILSPTALALYGINDNRAAVGTAPYYVKEYVTKDNGRYLDGVEFICSANSEYYLYERMPVIETIVIKINYEEQSKLDSFFSGEYDGFFTSSMDSYNALLESKLDFTLLKGHNNANPIFLNAREFQEFGIYEVRKAFNRLLDLDALNNELYGGLGIVQSSIWSAGSSGEVPWPEGFYYAPDEGHELLAAAGIQATDLHIETYVGSHLFDYFAALSDQLAREGITLVYGKEPPNGASTYLMRGDWTVTTGNFGYANISPHLPWTFILLPEHLIKVFWTDIYDPELYETMCNEYYAMEGSSTWDEMLTHCITLTDMVQKDYAALPGVQPPYFAAFNKELKGIVMTGEEYTLLWNYLYY